MPKYTVNFAPNGAYTATVDLPGDPDVDEIEAAAVELVPSSACAQCSGYGQDVWGLDFGDLEASEIYDENDNQIYPPPRPQPPAIAYPNRGHQRADEAARRRAIRDLDQFREHAENMARRLREGYIPDGQDAQRFASALVNLTDNMGRLETLRDVREWAAADQAEAARKDQLND